MLTGESVMQRPFWDTVVTHGCTSLAGVPYTYQMLERIGFRDMDLPALARCSRRAALWTVRPDRASTREHMARKGGRFFVMYGQTEATARIAYVPPDRLAEKLGSAGIAIPGGRLRIEDTGRRRAGRPATGEVVYEGPNVMLGYASGAPTSGSGDELARRPPHGRHRLSR